MKRFTFRHIKNSSIKIVIDAKAWYFAEANLSNVVPDISLYEVECKEGEEIAIL